MKVSDLKIFQRAGKRKCRNKAKSNPDVIHTLVNLTFSAGKQEIMDSSLDERKPVIFDRYQCFEMFPEEVRIGYLF